MSTNGHAAVLVAPSREITHAYVPRDEHEPWGLCACGFAESSHLASEEPYAPHGTYRCPDCVSTNKPACNHPAGEQPL